MNPQTYRELALNVAAFVTVIVLCGGYLATQAYDWDPFEEPKTAEMGVTNTGLILSGTGVFVSGVRIGEVREVQIQREGANLVLEYENAQQIPADSTVEIGLQSALGEPYINFSGGSFSGPALPDGAVIEAEQIAEPESIPGIFEEISTMSSAIAAGPMAGVLKTVSEALDGTEPALGQISDGTRLVAALLLSRSEQLRTMFSNTQVYTSNLGWIVNTLPEFSQGLDRVITDFQGALHTTANLVNTVDPYTAITETLHPFFERFNPYLEETIPPVMDAVGPLMPIVTALNQTVPQINMSELLARALELFGAGDGMRLVITQPN
ncbi:MlaD family protein [Gordonia sp. PKS22-38]|uniref:MlaD family protein n=1 Tax=Gordonia prachuapensis TaxID=3115651 RepID=A0ABU7MNC0_9ACTN|nr:MlaD family protein [Gordonia sp. PKS22-38]